MTLERHAGPGKDPTRSLLRAGLIGQSTSYSWSPIMHAAAFTASRIGARYELWNTEPEELSARIEEVRRNWPFFRDRRIDAYEGLTRRVID